jgi:glycerol-3-phosphate dehydrogenase (NAD(P)+)
MRKIIVIGDGGWGTALAILLCSKGLDVAIWSNFPDYASQLDRARENTKFLPGVKLPQKIRIVTETASAASAELAVMAVPTQHCRSVMKKFKGTIAPGTPVVSVAKGVENETLLRPSQVVRETLGSRNVCVLSGPSHAEEVAHGLPATVVAASDDPALAALVQETFMGEKFRVYTNPDVTGVELAAALKNIVAIAAGICDGMKLGDNTKSALLSRGIVEMARLGIAMGARKATFFGLAGIGDLITTCISPFGRNREVGVKIGQGMKLSQILASMEKVAEGVWTTKSVKILAAKHGVEMPIMEQVHEVLFSDKAPKDAIRDLMMRRAKSETEDLCDIA